MFSVMFCLEIGVKSAANNFNDGNRGVLSFQLC